MPHGRARATLRPDAGAATSSAAQGATPSPTRGHPTITTAAALVVAVAYCSWPIGLAVNPAVTRGELVSSLDVRGQPYNWLFILLDCVAALSTVVVVAATWPPSRAAHVRQLRTGLVCYGLFGIVAGIDALLPSSCGASSSGNCAPNLNQLNLDDILTGVSVFSLFLAAVIIHTYVIGTQRRRPSAVGPVLVTAAWAVCGLFLLTAHFSAQAPVTLQHLMLTMTSAVALILPLSLVATRPTSVPDPPPVRVQDTLLR